MSRFGHRLARAILVSIHRNRERERRVSRVPDPPPKPPRILAYLTAHCDIGQHENCGYGKKFWRESAICKCPCHADT